MRFHFHPFKSLSNLIKKEAVPWGTASFLAESKGFLLVFIVYHEGTNFLKTTNICATGGKRSTGAFSISHFRIPCFLNKKERSTCRYFFLFGGEQGVPTRLYCLTRRYEFSEKQPTSARRAENAPPERCLFRPFESLAFLTKKERSTCRYFFLFGGEQGVPTRLYCLPRRYEFSKNNRHLRDGRKTLHRSVFYFALSNPLLF